MNHESKVINCEEYNDNDYKNIFYHISKLPFYIVNEIKKYIPNKDLFFLSREKYVNFHHLIKQMIPRTKFENYIRNIVYRDFDFVFQQIVQENYLKWFEIKQYTYKNYIYKNYIYFIKGFCIQNNSEKCLIFLNNFLENLGLCKNQHKKNIIKYIRWKI